MSAPVFVDTNVLVYADDLADPVRRERAQELIRRVVREQSGHVSLQVLQEYFVAATRKLGMDADVARKRVALYSQLPVVRLEAEDVLVAIDLHRQHRVSFWDALILRAAMLADCQTLYTEDLQPGFRVGRLEVVNPFR